MERLRDSHQECNSWTTALRVSLHFEFNANSDVGIPFDSDTWDTRAVKVGDKVVISNSHPSLGYVFDALVTSTQRCIITLEWKYS